MISVVSSSRGVMASRLNCYLSENCPQSPGPTIVVQNAKFGAENPTSWEHFGGKIEILSTRNLCCRKFTASSVRNFLARLLFKPTMLPIGVFTIEGILLQLKRFRLLLDISPSVVCLSVFCHIHTLCLNRLTDLVPFAHTVSVR